MFRPGLARARLVALVFLAAAMTLLPAARAGQRELPKPSEILEIEGSIVAFAQDGDHVVWADRSAPCTRSVMLRRFSGGSAQPLVAAHGPVCGAAGGPEGSLHRRMALAGKRALWAYEYASNQSFNYDLFAGVAGGRERRVGSVSFEGGIEGGGGVSPPLDLAGDRSDLVYENDALYLVTNRARPIQGTKGASGFALDRGRFAVARDVPAVEVGNVTPEWSPDGRSIAFLSWRGTSSVESRQDLFVVRADGTNRRAVTRTGDVNGFDWSPDGRSFLVERYVDFKPVVFVVPAGGGSARKLTGGSEAAWSPDGRSVAFRREVLDEQWIFVMPGVGGDARRIAAGTSPEWSPDGSSIAFSDESGSLLRVVDVKGGLPRRVGLRQLGDFQGARSPLFAWSPDGTRIAYVAEGTTREVRVVGGDGIGDRRLAAHEELKGEVAWSFDSSEVAYTWWRADGNTSDLGVVSVVGGATRRIAVGSSPALSAGGDIAYVDESGEVARIRVDGSGRRVLTKTLGATEQRYSIEVRHLPGGADGSSFDVKPCSKVLGGGVSVTQLPQVFGLSGSRIALGIACADGKTERVEIRSLDGRVQRALTVTSDARDESFADPWLVYRMGRTILAVDTRSGQRGVLSRTDRPAIGLSIEGRRVAWAEAGPGKRSRILGLTLPH